MLEYWKPISGYEGIYMVSTFGRVKALERTIVKSDGTTQKRSEHIKTFTKNKDGYLTVGLSKNGEDKKMLVHRLVASAFLDAPSFGAEVNHKDFNRENNNVENLEWVSHVENIQYTSTFGKKRDIAGEKNPNYGNHILSERYGNNKSLALAKQSRSGKDNGRAIGIVAVFEDGKSIYFEYILECARFLISNNYCRSSNENSVAVSISKSLKSGKKYFGVSFFFR